MKTHILYVTGTHCKACKILIEDVLGERDDIERVTVDLSREVVTIEALHEEQLLEEWSQMIEPHGYRLVAEKTAPKKTSGALGVAVPLGLLLLALFFMLQRSGIVSIGFEGGFTLWTALLIGVIASLSSCLAIVGGLVLSLSATVSEEAATTARPFVFFHVGRLLGFIGLGAVLGAVGSALSISPTVTAVLGIAVAVIMVLLGFNLLDLFKGTGKFLPTLPRGLFDRLTKIENGFFAPFLVGAGTFFLPCGFTQSMQLAALSSGSVITGALIMGTFALGTFPMLALLSFGSFRFAHTKYAAVFFKTAGVVVVGLGVFALLGGLASLGLIAPLFNI